MSILVVGSVAYDSVKTAAGERKDSLGGSATYFSVASSYFAPVSLVAVVGDDFQNTHIGLLESLGIDLSGLKQTRGKTFRWEGVYGEKEVNSRETISTQLNVFANFSPSLTSSQRTQPFLFLANIDPDLQLNVLQQMRPRPKLVALDTMNFWIESKKSALIRVIEYIDILFMDIGEVRSFSNKINIFIYISTHNFTRGIWYKSIYR